MPRKRKPVLSTSGDKGPALAQRLCVQGTLDKGGAEVLVRRLRSTYSEDAAPHPRRTLEVTVESGVIPTGRGPHLRTQTESRVRTTTV